MTKAVVIDKPETFIDAVSIDSTALVAKDLNLPCGAPGTASIASDEPGGVFFRSLSRAGVRECRLSI